MTFSEHDIDQLKRLHMRCTKRALSWRIEYCEASDGFELEAHGAGESFYVKRARHLGDGCGYLFKQMDAPDPDVASAPSPAAL